MLHISSETVFCMESFSMSSIFETVSSKVLDGSKKLVYDVSIVESSLDVSCFFMTFGGIIHV